MQIDLYVYDADGKLQPLRRDCSLPVVPRIGETISLGTRKSRAKVMDVEYLLTPDEAEVLIGVILDSVPAGAETGPLR
jgi:hypothetical protein